MERARLEAVSNASTWRNLDRRPTPLLTLATYYIAWHLACCTACTALHCPALPCNALQCPALLLLLLMFSVEEVEEVEEPKWRTGREREGVKI